MTVCADCDSITICAAFGTCKRGTLALTLDMLLPEGPVKRLTDKMAEDIRLSDKSEPLVVKMPELTPAPPATPNRPRLPNSTEMIIKEGFTGGWLIQIPDGKFAVASNPETLLKIIADWAIKT